MHARNGRWGSEKLAKICLKYKNECVGINQTTLWVNWDSKLAKMNVICRSLSNATML